MRPGKRNTTTSVSATDRRISARRRLAGILLPLLLAGFVFAGFSSTAMADEYDEKMAGHPIRIVAYVLHPVGVIIDYLIMRPAHWLVSHEPLETLFGHED